MPVPVLIAVYSFIAGCAIICGGLLAWFERIPESENKRQWIHGLVAFGGGVLMAAVAFVLAPKGMEVLSLPMLSLFFTAGAFTFMLFDRYLGLHGGSLAQFMAMLMDFIPEAISLGAMFAHDRKTGTLLALFIGAQNLPEGFNSYRELTSANATPRRTLLVMLGLSFMGIPAGLAGYYFLRGYPSLVGALMCYAGGGILYLVFQDIAPLAKMKRHWGPALGATLGFLVGMIGEKVLG